MHASRHRVAAFKPLDRARGGVSLFFGTCWVLKKKGLKKQATRCSDRNIIRVPCFTGHRSDLIGQRLRVAPTPLSLACISRAPTICARESERACVTSLSERAHMPATT